MMGAADALVVPTPKRTHGYQVNAGLQTPKYEADNESDKELCTNLAFLRSHLLARAFEPRPDLMMKTWMILLLPLKHQIWVEQHPLPMAAVDLPIAPARPAYRTTRVPHGHNGTWGKRFVDFGLSPGSSFAKPCDDYT